MKALLIVFTLVIVLFNSNLFSIENTGNQTLDSFFTNVEKINTGIDAVKVKINHINSYIIWALNDPNDYNSNIIGKNYADAANYAYQKYASQASVTVNTSNFLNILTPQNMQQFMEHVKEAQKEMEAISKNVDEISKNAQDLINNAKALPAEAKSLSPLKAPKIISNIKSSVDQLQASMEGVKSIIQTIPITVQLITAIIGGQNSDIQISMFSKSPTAVENKQIKEKPSKSGSILVPIIVSSTWFIYFAFIAKFISS